MINQSDTPETDNALYPMNGVDIVWPDFARKLERERDQLRRWTSVNGVLELQRERDEARADAIRWQSIAEGRGRTNETLQPEREAENDKYIWQSVAESCGDSDETFFK